MGIDHRIRRARLQASSISSLKPTKVRLILAVCADPGIIDVLHAILRARS